jgi:hypothetical protein
VAHRGAEVVTCLHHPVYEYHPWISPVLRTRIRIHKCLIKDPVPVSDPYYLSKI